MTQELGDEEIPLPKFDNVKQIRAAIEGFQDFLKTVPNEISVAKQELEQVRALKTYLIGLCEQETLKERSRNNDAKSQSKSTKST